MNTKNYLRLTLTMFIAVTLFGGTTIAEDASEKEMTKTKVTSQSLVVAQGEMTDILLQSQSALEKIRAEQKHLTDEHIASAECIAIFPNFKKAAFLIGARHSDGVASCKTDNGKWSSIGFVDLRGVSFGAQAGFESGQVLALFHNEKAAQKLKDGKMRLAADVSYAMGEEGKEIEAASDRYDVTFYSDKEGFYAGAGLEGSYIVADDEEARQFYKEKHTLMTTLNSEPSEKAHAEIQELLVLLPSEKSGTQG
jgi:lipid-binding SYLF domain-containing protein